MRFRGGLGVILGIDPGTTQSGWVVLEGDRVRESGVSPNPDLIKRLRIVGGYSLLGLTQPMRLAIERFEARGMPISDDSIETVLWTGRFRQAWHSPEEVRMIRRSEVKLALCGTTRAKDTNVRQAVIDRLGLPGTKKQPGPTYGVTSHAWQALAVALVAATLAGCGGGDAEPETAPTPGVDCKAKPELCR